VRHDVLRTTRFDYSGNDGKMIVQVNLTRSAPPTRKHLAFVECNWRTDSEVDVAKKAVEAYAGLLRP